MEIIIECQRGSRRNEIVDTHEGREVGDEVKASER